MRSSVCAPRIPRPGVLGFLIGILVDKPRPLELHVNTIGGGVLHAAFWFWGTGTTYACFAGLPPSGAGAAEPRTIECRWAKVREPISRNSNGGSGK